MIVTIWLLLMTMTMGRIKTWPATHRRIQGLICQRIIMHQGKTRVTHHNLNYKVLHKVVNSEYAAIFGIIIYWRNLVLIGWLHIIPESFYENPLDSFIYITQLLLFLRQEKIQFTTDRLHFCVIVEQPMDRIICFMPYQFSTAV